jgi:hypothetical protein
MKGKQLLSDNANYGSKNKKQSFPTRISSMLRFPSFDRSTSENSNHSLTGSVDFREKIKKETIHEIQEQFGECGDEYGGEYCENISEYGGEEYEVENSFDAQDNVRDDEEKGIELSEKMEKRKGKEEHEHEISEEKAFISFDGNGDGDAKSDESSNIIISGVDKSRQTFLDAVDDDKTLVKIADESKEQDHNRDNTSDIRIDEINLQSITSATSSPQDYSSKVEKEKKTEAINLPTKLDLQHLDSDASSSFSLKLII